jgi:enterochelin esterase-like enzyme
LRTDVGEIEFSEFGDCRPSRDVGYRHRKVLPTMTFVHHFALAIILSAAALVFLNIPQAQGAERFKPLAVNLKVLASTDGLDLSDVKEAVVPFTFEDGTICNIRKRTFRFFSQRFLDEDWYHDAHLFESVDLGEGEREKGILLSHVYNNRLFDEMLDKYGLRTAAVVGVPVLVFRPNPVNKEFFKNHPEVRPSESQWQEFTFQKFRETGDINVTSFAVIMKAKWRALAAMDKVLGRKLTKVIYCGGSKGGASVRAMLKEDPRIVSVVSSGSIPFATDEYLNENKQDYVRYFIDAFHLRPSEFEESTIFFNIGTNDYNAPPTPVCDLYNALQGDRRMYTQPNGGHPAIADEQVKAMQLWCSHIFHGTHVPEVLPPNVTPRPDRLIFHTTIQQDGNVPLVELSYACFDPDAGKFTPGRRSPNAEWGKAKWTTIAMDKKDGAYVASLPRDVFCDDLAHLHVTVRAKVVVGHLVGYVSSPVYNQESYARHRHSLSQGQGQPIATPANVQSRGRKTTPRSRKPTKVDYKSPDIHGDGRVTFSITAPNATRVDLVGAFSAGIEFLAMEKDERGIWRNTLEGLEGGIYNYGFSINGGSLFADPLNHKVFPRKAEPTVWSLLEMPSADGSMFYEICNVPHGVVHSHLYRADSLSQTRRVHVYTPPDYHKTTEKHYPILYLLHGGSGLADAFLVAGRVDMILDNLIAKGEAEPMIVVMPQSSGVAPYVRLADGQLDRSRNFGEFEQSFFADTIPFVESKYRVSRAREDHAVAGFSVGAALARTIGLKHLDRFAWVGQFSGGGRLGDDYEETIPPLFKDVQNTNELLKLYWISGPTGKNSLPPFHQRLKNAEIDFVSRPDRYGHSYRTCRYILNCDFLPRLFRSE